MVSKNGFTNKMTFELQFKEDWFKVNQIISTEENVKLVVLTKPRRKWYHKVLRFITFGLYKTSVYYKVRRVTEDEAGYIENMNAKLYRFMYNLNNK